MRKDTRREGPRTLRFFVVTLLLLVYQVNGAAVARAQTASVPAATAAQTSAPKGCIRGRVLWGPSGGIAGATVTIASQTSPSRRSVTTDDAGKFSSCGLNGGLYTVIAEKAGFVGSLTTRQGGQRAMRWVSLADARETHIDVPLFRGGVVTGVLTDHRGEAVVATRIELLRSDSSGRMVRNIGVTTTDDRGEFRFHGLLSGSYYLRGVPASVVTSTTSRGREENWPTYFPGAPSLSEATALDIAPERETQGSFQLLVGVVHRVRGTVLSSSGLPGAGGTVIMRGAGEPPSTHGQRAAIGTNGAFELKVFGPGRYALAAQIGRVLEDSEYGEVVLDLNGENVDGVLLRTSDGGSLAGRLIVEEGSLTPESYARVRVVSMPEANDGFYPPPKGGDLDPDGLFRFDSAWGQRTFRVVGLPTNFVLKSVLLNGADVTESGVRFAPNQAIADLRVIVTTLTKTIEGIATDEDGRPLVDAAVVLVPDGEPQRHRSHVARVGPDGQFSVRNVLAGDYRAVTVTPAMEFSLEDEEQRQRVRQAATPVKVGDGATPPLALRTVLRLGRE